MVNYHGLNTHRSGKPPFVDHFDGKAVTDATDATHAPGP